MGATTTETLNWQNIVSGWSFSCAGEAPPEGLAESVVPAVERTNDGLFEITTISFGFSGTAPYHQQKFTAEFSFSVTGTANFYEIAVSSDDTATVHPTDVSFAYLYFWENEYPEMKTDLFAEEEINTVHTPSAPVQLNPQNQWTDRAYFALTFSENVITNATEDENGNVGILVWVCPVKWKKGTPSKEDNAPNTSLIADGALPDRVQTMRLRRPSPPPPLLSVLVSKEFNTGWTS